MSKGQIEFHINFTDVTLQESDGDYAETKRIMESEFPHPTDWMLESSVTIDSQFGIASFLLHFFADQGVRIIQYVPSVGDVYYNPDLGALSEWLQAAGWNVPEPTTELVKAKVDFWKHYWETLLIDSSYLDTVFGEREHADPDWTGENAGPDEDEEFIQDEG